MHSQRSSNITSRNGDRLRDTKLGKQQLIEWMNVECEPALIKDDLLVKIFAGYLILEQKLIEELEHHRKIHAQKLKAYQDIKQQGFPNPQTLPHQRQISIPNSPQHRL